MPEPRRTGEDFGDALAALLPVGTAWPRDPDRVLMQMVRGLGEEWARLDRRSADLLERESDPRFSTEMLEDWERALGLPDPCIAEPVGLIERRLALLQKLTARGGQSREYFTALAEGLGYRIEIRERSPFTTGTSELGVPYTGTAPAEVRFWWTVAVAERRWVRFTTGVSQLGIDPLLRIGLATDLECLIRRLKPAHTEVTFDYTGLDDHAFTAEPAGGWPTAPWPPLAWSAFGVSADMTYDDTL